MDTATREQAEAHASIQGTFIIPTPVSGAKRSTAGLISCP